MFLSKKQKNFSNQDLEKRIAQLEERITNLERKNLDSFQKIGFIRFNPFSETGGNVSFVIALLDGHNNGVVITSLHNRGGTRTYAKTVEKGISKYELSEDEQKAILKATNEGK